MAEEKRFAVLIDADNVSSKYIKYILDEISNYGIVTYKRIYGDWTNTALAGWKDVLLENSITPIQQYSYTFGKNATDSAMIIDAMDILYSLNVEGFCIVSSDSDFTKLVIRLRESGMMVIGMGEIKTPRPFSVACNIFKYLDILTEDEEQSAENDTAERKHRVEQKAKEAKNMTDIETIEKAMINIINENGDEDKGISIGELGNRILKRYPDFDVRNYGYTKLSKFLTSFECLVLHKNRSAVFVHLKDNNISIAMIKKATFEFVKGNGDPEMNLGQLNQWMINTYPEFNIKNYGYAKFSKFINDIDGLVIKSSGRNGCIKNVVLQNFI
ncbi:MAG: hypothetical protein K0R69_1620 [Clostridia bacterium]|jgi:uncharacterized LabA/DUF88 family protein|nr:hypothetical protein [Clostridia bacterium]